MGIIAFLPVSSILLYIFFSCERAVSQIEMGSQPLAQWGEGSCLLRVGLLFLSPFSSFSWNVLVISFTFRLLQSVGNGVLSLGESRQTAFPGRPIFSAFCSCFLPSFFFHDSPIHLLLLTQLDPCRMRGVLALLLEKIDHSFRLHACTKISKE